MGRPVIGSAGYAVRSFLGQRSADTSTLHFQCKSFFIFFDSFFCTWFALQLPDKSLLLLASGAIERASGKGAATSGNK